MKVKGPTDCHNVKFALSVGPISPWRSGGQQRHQAWNSFCDPTPNTEYQAGWQWRPGRRSFYCDTPVKLLIPRITGDRRSLQHGSSKPWEQTGVKCTVEVDIKLLFIWESVQSNVKEMNTLEKVQHLDHSCRMATRASLIYNHASSRSLKTTKFGNWSHFPRCLFLPHHHHYCLHSVFAV